jgi:hypothetical protein
MDRRNCRRYEPCRKGARDTTLFKIKKVVMRYTLIAYSILLCLIALLATSCNIQQRQIRKLDALALQQPAEFTRLSNLLNPCFTGEMRADTIINIGMPDTIITHVETRALPGQVDTIFKTITIKQPYTIHITDTVPDKRKEGDYIAQIKTINDGKVVSDTKLKLTEATSRKRLYWIIGLAAFIVIYFGFKLYSFLSGNALIK